MSDSRLSGLSLLSQQTKRMPTALNRTLVLGAAKVRSEPDVKYYYSVAYVSYEELE